MKYWLKIEINGELNCLNCPIATMIDFAFWCPVLKKKDFHGIPRSKNCPFKNWTKLVPSKEKK